MLTSYFEYSLPILRFRYRVTYNKKYPLDYEMYLQSNKCNVPKTKMCKVCNAQQLSFSNCVFRLETANIFSEGS